MPGQVIAALQCDIGSGFCFVWVCKFVCVYGVGVCVYVSNVWVFMCGVCVNVYVCVCGGVLIPRSQ